MGIGEEVKGKMKQVAGDVTDNENLRREGRAQEEKGHAERDATSDRMKAKAHEAEAREKAAEQRAAERQ